MYIPPIKSTPNPSFGPNVRELTGHQIGGAAECTVRSYDAKGAGGAHHIYGIEWGSSEDDALRFSFQNGPIKEVGQNGVTQEALLAVLIDRLQCFQAGPFASPDNEVALNHLAAALDKLQERTRKRLARGVEGQNKV